MDSEHADESPVAWLRQHAARLARTLGHAIVAPTSLVRGWNDARYVGPAKVLGLVSMLIAIHAWLSEALFTPGIDKAEAAAFGEGVGAKAALEILDALTPLVAVWVFVPCARVLCRFLITKETRGWSAFMRLGALTQAASLSFGVAVIPVYAAGWMHPLSTSGLLMSLAALGVEIGYCTVGLRALFEVSVRRALGTGVLVVVSANLLAVLFAGLVPFAIGISLGVQHAGQSEELDQLLESFQTKQP